MQNENVENNGLAHSAEDFVKLAEEPFFSIKVNKATDTLNKEQVVLSLRWVDENLEVHEVFIGLNQVPNTSSGTLV